MKDYDSKLFGTVPEPESFPELINLITAPEEEDQGRVRLWRGHANIAWRLDSSAVRRLAQSGDITLPISQVVKAENTVTGYEKSLMSRAEHRGFRHFEGRTLTDLELLARLRHYGAATRLVDMSKSALVATWFAVADEPDIRGALFGLHCDYLAGDESNPWNGPYDEIVEMLVAIDPPVIFGASGLTPRIAAQHSQFVYSNVTADPKGSVKILPDSRALLTISLTPELKRETKEILRQTFDLYHLSLFPDVEGFSSGNSEKYNCWETGRW